jgi:hypothetical protein
MESPSDATGATIAVIFSKNFGNSRRLYADG